MTRDEINSRYEQTLKEIKDIEIHSDKARRLRWRELQKIKSWLEHKLQEIDYRKEEEVD